MNTELTTYDNKLFGSLRTAIQPDGSVVFVAQDVCKALGFRDTYNGVRYLDEDEKGTLNWSTPGGVQAMTIVTEAGLYSLVLRSRKPAAKEFKRWITHKVIPAIRKHGMYATAVTTA